MTGKDIRYVGVNDHQIDLFEGQYVVPDGMSYNSYAIVDEQIAVMDSVDRRFAGEWLEKLEKALEGRQPDYLVVHHMEPDHSASITAFLNRYPEAKVVASAKAFAMMQNFFGCGYEDRRIVVAEGSTLSLGRHELTFIAAPMIHWPEVMMSYDAAEKALFSADAFGKFGALDVEDEWACEARRYYFGIVGKYGAQVQALLKKAAALDIQAIYPLHGPVLDEDVQQYIRLYDTWSAYRAEDRGVVIAYASMYGNTREAALLLAEMLRERGVKVSVFDLAREDMAEAVEDAFRYDTLVLAAPTYNAGVFPVMKEYIHHLTERNYQNRTVALIENGSWAPTAAKVMRGMLEGSKNLTFAEVTVRILSALGEESRAQLGLLADELCRS
ncbi:MAG: FprA family A-type flavoprotein [Clostridia bacterium]|nr:FprA family A-type flavoprotein [Clostridia bacterium]